MRPLLCEVTRSEANHSTVNLLKSARGNICLLCRKVGTAGAVSSDGKHKPNLMTAINGKRSRKEDAVKK
jgi:hypothetical protein